MDHIVITAAKRTPTGNFGGYFKNIPATELGCHAIKAAIEQAKLKPEQIDSVNMGCVLPANLGQAPARQAALFAGIPQCTGCTTINKMCGSGMKAVMLAHDTILAGTHEVMIAGGMENMSRAPYLAPDARFGYRLGHGEFIDHMMRDGLEDAYDKGKPMGYFAQVTADKYKISRKDMDKFAQMSYDRAKKATDDELFKTEITPITVKERKKEFLASVDEGTQTIDPNKIPQLKPAFTKDGSVTAANSSSIADGAAALVITTEKKAQALNSKPIAKIIGHYTHAQAPEWFTTAPISAIEGLCQKINWTIDEVDLFEINEAFAVVTMVTMRELNISHEKVNVHGGACVLGHPIGASGARILTTLIYALQQRDLKRGIAALCIGGGEATAVAIELW
jgi:acetyl-CoA C-acetyltransferase